MVTMPLKGTLNSLGDSRKQAEKRLLSLEKRLQTNKSLANRYIEFMNQYQALGHMVKVDDSSINTHTLHASSWHIERKQPNH